MVRDGRYQLVPKPPADSCALLGNVPGRHTQPVKPRDQGGMQRGRHGERRTRCECQRLGVLSTRLDNRFVTSSMNRGTPSVRSAISRTNSECKAVASNLRDHSRRVVTVEPVQSERRHVGPPESRAAGIPDETSPTAGPASALAVRSCDRAVRATWVDPMDVLVNDEYRLLRGNPGQLRQQCCKVLSRRICGLSC